jgi:putative membrane protein
MEHAGIRNNLNFLAQQEDASTLEHLLPKESSMVSKRITGAAAAVAMCFVTLGCATPGAKDNDTPLSMAEQKFMNEAAQDSTSEVVAGKLAAQKATNPQVKQYAQRMVKEHTMMNEMMMQLAQKKNMVIPAKPDEQHTQAVAMLSNMSGKEFDIAYMSQQVTDHSKSTAMFDMKTRTATDPELRSFVTQHAPIMRQHLEEAQRISQTLTGGGDMGNNMGTGNNMSGGNNR